MNLLKLTKTTYCYILLLLATNCDYGYAQNTDPDVSPIAQRKYLVESLIKIADPVLSHLSRNELKKNMKVEHKSAETEKYTHLEAFARTLAGMAPWLELGADSSAEGKLRKKYINMARLCIKNATNENATDFLNFNKGKQPLVDASFLAEALLRAPKQLWEPLDAATKANVIRAFKTTRVITPNYNNWLLFSAMIEAALLQFDGSGDMTRIDYALRQHTAWYKGDGIYGDGPNFHWDYYNSYVIHPMILEVLKALENSGYKQKTDFYSLELKRAQRYAEILERQISPEATYPAIGRSLAYRFGAFHLLSKMAQMKMLPENLSPQQVRFALYHVVKKQLEIPGTFNKDGWLTIGFAGHQPGIGETYISTGSLYLCSQVFLILGLPVSDPLWQGKNEDWTSRKIWGSKNMGIDQAYKED